MHLPVNVMMISSSYPQGSKDWKSIFIRQMLSALAERTDVNMSYWGPSGWLPRNVVSACSSSESVWLADLMSKGGLIHLLRNSRLLGSFTILKFLIMSHRALKSQEHVNIFHVNWLQNALALRGRKQPALITVLGSDLRLLKIPGLTMLLRDVIKKRSCILAPNAEWMVDELRLRFGDIAKVVPIPLGINDEWFAVQRKRKIVSPDKWLVVARVTHKKMGPLFDWGKKVFANNSKRELHLFGPLQENVIIPEWVNYHGSTYPDALQKEWFPQSAGLITTSEHDEGRPQVMLEAMAAGLPIIASDIPAHRSFITHQENGLLVGSEEQFVSAIQWLSFSGNHEPIIAAARQWVKREVGTWSDCAERYSAVYHTLLGEVE